MNLSLIIYVIGLLDSLNLVLLLISLGIVIAICFYIMLLAEASDSNSTKHIRKYKDIFKKLIISLSITLLIRSFIPEEEQSYKILIASQVTKQNYTKIKSEIIDTVDYMVDKVDEITKK